jgi:muramoyltetrapeptide carboxypeptidase
VVFQVNSMKKIRIGIVAASSVVPKAEFCVGVTHLRDNGFDVTVHPDVLAQHFTFAGTDEQRVNSLFDFAHDDQFDVIWTARGGYGATRLLPRLDQLTRERGIPPRKLLVGYSDVTPLHEYVRSRWNWATLHAPMPAALSFVKLRPEEWLAIVACVQGERPAFAWEQTQLRFMNESPAKPIRGELIGGNLSLWAAMTGTPYAPVGRGKILFFEDVGEPPYRIDRMITQLAQSGAFDGALAIVLGDFTDCADEDNQCLKPLAEGEDPRKLLENVETREKISLRRVYTLDESLAEIFGTVVARMKIPVAVGLPVGHGPNYSPLPLGASYELSFNGKLRLVSWDWFDE